MQSLLYKFSLFSFLFFSFFFFLKSTSSKRTRNIVHVISRDEMTNNWKKEKETSWCFFMNRHRVHLLINANIIYSLTLLFSQIHFLIFAYSSLNEVNLSFSCNLYYINFFSFFLFLFFFSFFFRESRRWNRRELKTLISRHERWRLLSRHWDEKHRDVFLWIVIELICWSIDIT